VGKVDYRNLRVGDTLGFS
jgi:hypothetical protein